MLIPKKVNPITVNMDTLNAAINVLQQNPSKVDVECMICLTTNPENANQTFYDCEILNNIEYLCSAYIKACGEATHTFDLQKAA